MKIRLEKVAQSLSLTKAEISLVSLLLGFLVLGGILKNFRSVEEESILRKKAERALYREAEVDSLLRSATAAQATVNEEVQEEADAEENGQPQKRQAAHRSTEKKVFNGTMAFNKASLAQLQKIPGIGPVMAMRLITFRKAKGGHVKEYQELLEVKGVGKKKLELLKKHLTLEE